MKKKNDVKKNERLPEEIAKDLENVDFPEIAENDLKDIFGGDRVPIETNCNCCC